MAQTTAMLDFFVLEASDYLERLDAVVQARAGTPPSGDEFVRLARAFRGSALMANQQVMARAAQGLEAAARAVRDGRLAWDDRVRGDVIRAIDDCKVLLRRVKSPEVGDADRAEAIGLGLERLAGPATTPPARGHAGGLDAGARAFVGREAAAIASSLDRVARSLTADPLSRDALGGVTHVMSQLRGVAILNDLPPLADLLAAVDGAVKLVLETAGPASPHVAAVFDAAARALARAAREVVEAGRPAAESAEARSFASALLNVFVRVSEPVPIELLCAHDAGPPVVTVGHAPAGGEGPPRVELVSQGEFLSAVAAGLARADNTVVRDLRLFVVGAMLKPLISADGSALGRALAGFADAGWWAIGTGAAAAEPERFAEVVSDAASTLQSADRGDDARLAQLLGAHASRLLLRLPYPPQALAGEALLQPPPAAAPTRPAAPAPAAAPAAAVATAPDEGGLAASWTTYEALIAERGLARGSLEEFLGVAGVSAPRPAEAPAPAREVPIVPIESLAPSEPDVVPIESLAPSEPDVVPIESLLYDRGGARLRLLALRGELDTALAAAGIAAPTVHDLLAEVFDLVAIDAGT